MKRTALLSVLLASIALAGCQTIKAHNPFRHKAPAYQTAQQEQPLEVPPGMNQPPSTEALVIPNAATGSAASNAGTAPATQPETGAPPAEAAPAMATGASTSSMTLSDTPASVYHRVGLALARGEVGPVTAHNDTALTYQIAVDTVVTEKSEGGFFHRLFHHSHNEIVKGMVTVSVAPQGSGSVVEVAGNPDASAKVMAVLKQRLQ